MHTYVLKRVLQMIPLLLLVSMISFGIMHLAPGGPISLLLEQSAGSGVDAEKVEELKKEYGLDQPIPVQYIRWLTKILQGDLGKSFMERLPVTELIADRLPNTLLLSGITILLSYAVAIPLGVISAIKQYSKFDYVITFLAFLFDAMPAFWLSYLMIYLFSVNLGWLPTSGISTFGFTVARKGLLVVVLDRLQYIIMPMTVLVLHSLAGLTRYMRSSMLEVIREDYVRTARSKGLNERVVIYKHALRNAILPVVTIAAGILPGLFSGAIIIETIYSWPGLGLLAIRAINQRDYSIVMALNMMGAVMTVTGILIVDIAYVFVDPRIKYA